jgi:hypothetical protein
MVCSTRPRSFQSCANTKGTNDTPLVSGVDKGVDENSGNGKRFVLRVKPPLPLVPPPLLLHPQKREPPRDWGSIRLEPITLELGFVWSEKPKRASLLADASISVKTGSPLPSAKVTLVLTEAFRRLVRQNGKPGEVKMIPRILAKTFRHPNPSSVGMCSMLSLLNPPFA